MATAAQTSPATDSLLSEVEPASSRKLLEAALESFAERGFHATTTRDISTKAGLSPAAVYVHYASKIDLLFELSRIGHEAVLESVKSALSSATDPTSRLREFVFSFSRWHAEHHTLARVLQYELHALPADRLDVIVELRRQFDKLVDRQLRAGLRAGDFNVQDLPGTRRAILSLGIDVARWYGPQERRSPEAVGALYADLVLQMLDA